MRAIFGVLSLLVVLAGVGLLVKKQLASPPVIATPAGMPAAAPGATVPQQSQQIQQQYKQALEGALQAPRAVPDDKKED